MWLIKAALMSPDTQPACLNSLAALMTYTDTSEQIALVLHYLQQKEFSS